MTTQTQRKMSVLTILKTTATGHRSSADKHKRSAIHIEHLAQNYRATFGITPRSVRISPWELDHINAIAYANSDEARLPVPLRDGEYAYDTKAIMRSCFYGEELVARLINRTFTYKKFLKEVVPYLVQDKKFSRDYGEMHQIFEENSDRGEKARPRLPFVSAAPKYISPEVTTSEELQVYFLNMERKNPSLSLVKKGKAVEDGK